MNGQQDGKSGRSLVYATSFDEKLLGVGCDVEIVVDIESGDAQAIIAMRSFLRSTPAFRISSEDLVALSRVIASVRSHSTMLDHMVDGAIDHQLNYSAGGATLIVVHPKDKKARFTLSIGAFHREGDLEKLSDKEIADTVARVEELKAKVITKVALAKK